MFMTVTSKLGVPKLVDDGFALPGNFTARFDFERSSPTVELSIAIEDGQPVCNEVRVIRAPGRPALTKGELRRLPLAELMAYACTEAAMRVDGPGQVSVTAERDPAALETFTKKRRRNTLTDELLRAVAGVVQRHEADGPGAAADALVAERSISKATAYRWIATAREKGILAETRKGEAQ